MLRVVSILSLAAALFAAAAGAQVQLTPGITYDRQVQFTTHGPAVVDVLAGPRPGGLWSLKPVLSNESILGTEKLTAIEQRLAPGVTSAGIGGDFFAADGHPFGLLIRNSVLDHQPLPSRSSLGIDASGALLLDRLALFATWQGSGQRQRFNLVNDPLPSSGIALYTPSFGATAPAVPGTISVTLEPFGALVPQAVVSGPVTQAVRDTAAPIPPDGAVLVGRGAGAIATLTADAPVGRSVAVRPILKPAWNVTDAIGGGPVLVANGKAIFRAGEAFTTTQLLARTPRAAVGQLKDGRILLVAVEGSQPGLSTGMTNFELAQTMLRLGCVTAMALGPGAPATMAYDGQLLAAQPNPAAEQPQADALLLEYAGVIAPPPSEPVLSPNGDGVAETEQLAYRIGRPATVSAQLLGPDGVARSAVTGPVQPGTYPLAFSGLRSDGTPDLEGRYRWIVTATDDLGRQSAVERRFFLDNTLGFAKPLVGTLQAPAVAPQPVASFTETRSAAVTETVETPAGVTVRTIGKVQGVPGTLTVSWDGRTDAGTPVYSGQYVVRASAANEVGTVDLTQAVTVQRTPGS